MKKKLLIIILVSAALLMTNCRKNNVEPVQDGQAFGDYEMTLRAGNNEKGGIDGFVISWHLGDKVYVVDNVNGLLGYLTATEIGSSDGTAATFKGFITKPTAGNSCWFYYVGDNAFTITDGKYTYDVSRQYGGLNAMGAVAQVAGYSEGDNWKGGIDDVSNGLQLMKSTAALPISQTMLDRHDFGDSYIQMRSMMAISRLDLKVEGTSMDGYLTDSVTVSGAGCYATGTLDIKTGTLTPNAGTITLKKACGDFYMALIPANQGAGSQLTLKFKATSKRGEETGLTPTVAANKFYNYSEAKQVDMKTIETDEWVDFNDITMGVSGMPRWAKRNVGATCSTTDSPGHPAATTWYGESYAWAEIVPYYTKTWTNDSTVATYQRTTSTIGCGGTVDEIRGHHWYSYTIGNYNPFTEWNVSPCTGEIPYDITTNVMYPKRDIASVAWGGTWRMASGGETGEWQLLKNNTYWVWTVDYNGVHCLNGYVVYRVHSAEHKGYTTYYNGTSWYTENSAGTAVTTPEGYTISDTHIFIPAAGYHDEQENTRYVFPTRIGFYWSRTRVNSTEGKAFGLYFNKSGTHMYWEYARYYGFSVRPVCDTPNANAGNGANDFVGGTW